jgi:hypothetical protein
VVDPRPAAAEKAGLNPNDTPTRESKNVVALLAAYEAKLDRDRKTPIPAPVPRVESILPPRRQTARSEPVVVIRAARNADELGAAAALVGRDERGSADELANVPPTRGQGVLSQFDPARRRRRTVLLILLGALALALLAAAAMQLLG